MNKTIKIFIILTLISSLLGSLFYASDINFDSERFDWGDYLLQLLFVCGPILLMLAWQWYDQDRKKNKNHDS